MENDKKIIFISGHGDLTDKEFDEFYKNKINEHIALNNTFIICDFKGADTKAQNYLKQLNYKKVIIVNMFENPRYKADSEWKSVNGFKTDEERDTYCPLNSSEDILFIRKGKEKSGTAANLKRRINKSWIK